MRQRYDAGSKWLIDHHPAAILRVAGFAGVRAARAVASEQVQPRQLPDGLIEADIDGQPEPVTVLVEVQTDPERRVPEELMDDIALTYLSRRRVPEAVTLVLRPKGNLRVDPSRTVVGPLGGTELSARWRVVELWNEPAEPVLAAGDPGLIPWAVLMRYDGAAEPFLRRCEQVIEDRAAAAERESLQVVTGFMCGLRFTPALIRAVFQAEGRPMIDWSESSVVKPLLDHAILKERRQGTLQALEVRFGPVPEPVTIAVRAVDNADALNELFVRALRAASLAEFEAQLSRPAGSPLPPPGEEGGNPRSRRRRPGQP